jgi:hypothetical protein
LCATFEMLSRTGSSASLYRGSEMDGRISPDVNRFYGADPTTKRKTSSIHSDDRKRARKEPRSNKRMHSQDSVDILKTWLFSDEHAAYPYPTEDQKKVHQRRIVAIISY